MAPGEGGVVFGIGKHASGSDQTGGFNVHCYNNHSAMPSGAPFIGKLGVSYCVRQCWIRCGCWTVPFAHGGQGAITTYCGSGHCGQGGVGGGGIVKITYV